MNSHLFGLISLGVLLVGVACGDKDGGPEEAFTTQPSTATETPADVAEKAPTPTALVDVETIKAPPPGTEIDCTDPETRSAIVLSLLARVPAHLVVEKYIFYDDYECARRLLGIALPAQDAPPSEVMAYRDALLMDAYIWNEHVVGVAGHLAGFSQNFDVRAWNTEVGFNAASVDQHLSSDGTLPGRTVHLRGRFDPAAIDSAVRTDPAWSGLLETVMYDATTWYYAWGEDYEDRRQPRTPLRPIGRGGRMFVDGGYLTWAYGTSELAAAIDASLGMTASVAETPGYRELAEALAAASTLSFMVPPRPHSLSDSVHDIRNAFGQDRLDRLYQEGTLGRFEVFAAGAGFESGSFYSILVYLFVDEASAQAGASALEQMLEFGHSLNTGEPWASQFERFEVTTSGRTVFARIWTDDPWLAVNAYNFLDSITLSE